MSRMNEIIEVNITRETRGVSRQGFGKPLFIGTTGFNDNARVRTYTAINQVEEDFVDGDPELTAARRFFGQQVAPASIKIGHHDPAAVASVTYAVSPADETTYTFTINGVQVSYTSDTGDTARQIIEGIELEFANTVTDARFVKADDAFTIYPDDPDNFDYSTTAPELTETENIETYLDAYRYIKRVDGDYYYVTMESRDPLVVEDMADVVQSEKRIFVSATEDRKAPNPLVTTDIGSILQAKDLTRTVLLYSKDASEYPECALVGLQAPKAPGTSTWKFRSVSGVTISDLSTTESLTLKGTRYDYGKGYNTYENIGGRNIIAEGRVANGEFIDIIIFSDWLESRMRERVYQTLTNKEKLPLTNSGIAIIQAQIQAVLNEGVAVGGLANYSVETPNISSISPNERSNRVVDGFTFEGTLLGAVHFVTIRGNLVV